MLGVNRAFSGMPSCKLDNGTENSYTSLQASTIITASGWLMQFVAMVNILVLKLWQQEEED